MKRLFRFAMVMCLVTTYSAEGTHADEAQLADLLNGGALVEGGQTYSNFLLVGDDGSVSPDVSQIRVATTSSGLEFASVDQFQLDSGLDTIAFQVQFDANTVGPGFLVAGADLGLANSQPGDSGVVDLFAEFSRTSGDYLVEANAFDDPFLGEQRLVDTQLIGSSESDIRSIASFTLFADPTSAVSVDSFRVTISVPEPASGSLFALLGGVCLFRRRRR